MIIVATRMLVAHTGCLDLRQSVLEQAVWDKPPYYMKSCTQSDFGMSKVDLTETTI